MVADPISSGCHVYWCSTNLMGRARCIDSVGCHLKSRAARWFVLATAAGFSLIELLIAIAVIGILAGTVIVAVNPARQLAQADDAARRVHASALLNAILQYTVDHQGLLPSQLSAAPRAVGTCAVAECPNRPAADRRPCVPFDHPVESTLVPTYLAEIPRDRAALRQGESGFYALRSLELNTVVVGSCYATERVEVEG